jgi:hypothetical protein
MSIHSRTKTSADFKGGAVWNRLHAEREEICSALLHDARRPHFVRGLNAFPIAGKQREQNRFQLQARLRLLDDALDRLISGSYGDCSKCGRWIEDDKLAANPTLAYCAECETLQSNPAKISHPTSLDYAKDWQFSKERSAQWRP